MTEKHVPTLEERCTEAARSATLYVLAQAGRRLVKAWIIDDLTRDGDNLTEVQEVLDEWAKEAIAEGLAANAKSLA